MAAEKKAPFEGDKSFSDGVIQLSIMQDLSKIADEIDEVAAIASQDRNRQIHYEKPFTGENRAIEIFSDAAD